MKFLFVQIISLIVSVTFLLYLLSLEYFLPYGADGVLNYYNLVTVLILLFVLVESLISLLVFLVQKFVAFSWGEFPSHKLAVKWGLIFAVAIVGGILLNIFDILVFPWGPLALLLVIILLTVI
jgi:hypothetical protein